MHPKASQHSAPTVESERAIVMRETMISTVPNALVSAAFVWLLFAGQATVSLWGISGLAFDLVPTTFMLTLMTTIGLTPFFESGVAAPCAQARPAAAARFPCRIIRYFAG